MLLLQVQNIIKELFGDSVVAMYLYGSAVLGGLQKNSDMDILAVSSVEICDEVRRTLTEKLMQISGEKGNKQGKRHLELSIVKLDDIVPWKYPPRMLYQYGEWLRRDIENGVFPQPKDDPDLAVILGQICRHGITLFGKDAAQLLQSVPAGDVKKAMVYFLPELVENVIGEEQHALLTLSRMWATVETGDFFPKDKAAEWAAARLPEEYRELLNLAAKAYRGECEVDWKLYNKKTIQLAELLKTKILTTE